MKYMVIKGTDVLIQCSGADVLIYVGGKGLNGGGSREDGVRPKLWAWSGV